MAVFLLPATLAAVAPLTPLRSSVGPLSIPAMPGVRGRRLSAIRLSETTPRAAANARPVKAESWTPPPPKDGDYVDIFCRATNSFFESTTLPFIREAVTLRASQGPLKPLQRLTSPPESPGLSRPVWLVIAASVPTGLLWYGYYKFSVEEELFYDELRREGRVTGCGGYGTLISFSWLVLLGLLGKAVGAPAADALIDGAALWILLGQVNLYRRANELCTEKACGVEGPPLYAWWALLPPPLDVVVGLRQVHFLARYWSAVRGEVWQPDVVAEEYFPFIASPRFTLREFVTQPRRWFGFSKSWPDIHLPGLPTAGPAGAETERAGEGGARPQGQRRRLTDFDP